MRAIIILTSLMYGISFEAVANNTSEISKSLKKSNFNILMPFRHQTQNQTQPRPKLFKNSSLTLTSTKNISTQNTTSSLRALNDSVPSDAFYETIVYNPDSDDATSYTTSSQSHNYNVAPVLSNKEVENTPKFVSIQTPLNKIRYKGRQRIPPRPVITTSPPPFFENERESEDSDETSLGSNNEETKDDFDSEEDGEKLYSEVLSNIESLFSDDHVNGLRKGSDHWNSDFSFGESSAFEEYILDPGLFIELGIDDQKKETEQPEESKQTEVSNPTFKPIAHNHNYGTTESSSNIPDIKETTNDTQSELSYPTRGDNRSHN